MAQPKSMVPQLFESSGANAGRVHELPYGVHVLGRGSEASIQLEHEDVSRRHAELQVGPEGVLVRDLDSKNGVRVGSERVDRPRRVAHGETIMLGELALVLSHPASQVSHALARAGETTMTTTTTGDERSPGGVGLVLPLVGVVVFGGLVAAMWLM